MYYFYLHYLIYSIRSSYIKSYYVIFLHLKIYFNLNSKSNWLHSWLDSIDLVNIPNQSGLQSKSKTRLIQSLDSTHSTDINRVKTESIESWAKFKTQLIRYLPTQPNLVFYTESNKVKSPCMFKTILSNSSLLYISLSQLTLQIELFYIGIRFFL